MCNKFIFRTVCFISHFGKLDCGMKSTMLQFLQRTIKYCMDWSSSLGARCELTGGGSPADGTS